MKHQKLWIAFLFLILGICSLSSAQHYQSKIDSISVESDSAFLQHFDWVKKKNIAVHELNFIGGYSFQSNRGFWGKIPGAQLSLFSIRYNQKLLTYRDKHLIEYVGEVNFSANYTLTSSDRVLESGSFTGFGLAPVGLQINFGKDNTVQPFFKSSGGFLIFSKPFPDERGTRFNFTLELGGGLEFLIAPNFSLSLGYKYHHLSNGEFGEQNPGVDSNVFYGGITIF